MNGHLVTVEVCVECGTDEWVKLDCLAFNKLWLESLDAQTVQGWCTVQQNRTLANDFFENTPNLRTAALNHALCALDVLSQTLVNKALHYERLEEFECHQLWQTTLVQLELWTNHDDRTARVVHALAKKVLTETTLLALEQIAQRL